MDKVERTPSQKDALEVLLGGQIIKIHIKDGDFLEIRKNGIIELWKRRSEHEQRRRGKRADIPRIANGNPSWIESL